MSKRGVSLESVYLIKPEIFSQYDNILAVLTTKKFVNSDDEFNVGFTINSDPEKIRRNREILFKQLGIVENQLAIPKQIHSSNVCIVDKPGIYENCDALVTNQKEIYLVVSVADCAPVYIYDKVKNVISLVHCGWKGAKERIVENTIKTMIENFGSNPRDLIVHIGACASVCCYEVDKEFENFFNVRFLRFKNNGKFHFDLKGEIFSQLIKFGVDFRNIGISRHCTICEKGLFHSYRRDKDKSGRMWALLGIRK